MPTDRPRALEEPATAKYDEVAVNVHRNAAEKSHRADRWSGNAEVKHDGTQEQQRKGQVEQGRRHQTWRVAAQRNGADDVKYRVCQHEKADPSCTDEPGNGTSGGGDDHRMATVIIRQTALTDRKSGWEIGGTTRLLNQPTKLGASSRT